MARLNQRPQTSRPSVPPYPMGSSPEAQARRKEIRRLEMDLRLGQAGPRCCAPNCQRPATRHSRDFPELTWCEDDASPLDSAIETKPLSAHHALVLKGAEVLAERERISLERLAIRNGPIGVNPRPPGLQAPSGPLSRYTRGGYLGPSEGSQPTPEQIPKLPPKPPRTST